MAKCEREKKKNAEEGEDRMATEPNIRSGHKTFARYCRCSHSFVSQKCPQWTNPPKQIYKFSIFPVLTSPRISLVCFLFLRFSFLWLLSTGQAKERQRAGGVEMEKPIKNTPTALRTQMLQTFDRCHIIVYAFPIRLFIAFLQCANCDKRMHRMHGATMYDIRNVICVERMNANHFCGARNYCVLFRRRDEKRWDVNVADGKSIKFAISFFWEKIHKF